MCFSTGISSKESKPEPKITVRDIKVYKVIRKNGTGVYRDLRYKNGNMMLWKPGYHYTELPDTNGNVFGIKIRLDEWAIYKGLHSIKTPKKAKIHIYNNDCIIVKMIIPKGSKYFKNKDEYVSDQLVYIHD